MTSTYTVRKFQTFKQHFNAIPLKSPVKKTHCAQ